MGRMCQRFDGKKHPHYDLWGLALASALEGLTPISTKEMLRVLQRPSKDLLLATEGISGIWVVKEDIICKHCQVPIYLTPVCPHVNMDAIEIRRGAQSNVNRPRSL